MIKVCLFDVDGVVIASRSGYFTDLLISDFGVTPEESKRFVHEALFPALAGKVKLREVLPLYLEKWGLNKTVDEISSIGGKTRVLFKKRF